MDHDLFAINTILSNRQRSEMIERIAFNLSLKVMCMTSYYEEKVGRMFGIFH